MVKLRRFPGSDKRIMRAMLSPSPGLARST
jgi:hypothetical protein